MGIRKFAIQETAVSQSDPKSRIYLDHAATTPIRPEALAAMQEGFAIWANPSSPHAEGRKAKQALESARARIKTALNWDGEVIFTSGASEAAALALTRSKARECFVSAVEHDCVLNAAPSVPRLPVLPNGAVDAEAMKRLICEASNPLVCIQQVNSETGNRHNHTDLTDAVHEAGGLVLADCAQGAGKYPLPLESDMVMIAAHKFGGPVGIGALLVKDYAMLEPVGGHERGYRRGTENLPAILGMAAALDVGGDGTQSVSAQDGVMEASNSLADAVRSAGGVWFDDRLDAPTDLIHAIGHPSLSGQAQLMRLDLAGFAVSQGSACSSGTMKSSPVLQAMNVEDALAERTIRVSYGWNTTREDIEQFIEAWAKTTN